MDITMHDGPASEEEAVKAVFQTMVEANRLASEAEAALASGEEEQARALFRSAAQATAQALSDLPREKAPGTWELLTGNHVALLLKAGLRELAIAQHVATTDPSPWLAQRLEEIDARGLRRADVNAVFLLGEQAGELAGICAGDIIDQIFFTQDDRPCLQLWSGQLLLEIFTQDGEVHWNLDNWGTSLAGSSSGMKPCQVCCLFPEMLDELREHEWEKGDEPGEDYL